MRVFLIRIAALLPLLFLPGCPGPVERQIPCGILDVDVPDREEAPEVETIPDDDDLPADDEGPDADEPLLPFILQWGSAGDDAGFAAVATADGTLFVTGGTTGDLAGGTSAGSSDLFLTRITPQREFAWTRQWGTANFDQGSSLAMDAGGRLYLSGWRDAIVDPFTGAGIGRMFIARHADDGAEQWIREWGTFEQEYPSGASVDAAGNIYVTGWTYGTLGTTGNQGLSDIFLSRFDSTGDEKWSTQWGSGLIDVGYSVAAGSVAGIYVTGWTYGDLASEGSFGGNDVFLTRLSADGSIDWTRQWGSYSEDKSYAVTVAIDGSIYIAGSTTGGLGGFSNIGGQDCFLIKFSAAGEPLWTYQWGTPQDDLAIDATVVPDGAVYVTGWTLGDMDGNISNGERDIFLTAVSPDGVEVRTLLYGTPERDVAESILLSGDRLIVTGWTGGSLGADNAGGFDIFALFQPLD